MPYVSSNDGSLHFCCPICRLAWVGDLDYMNQVVINVTLFHRDHGVIFRGDICGMCYNGSQCRKCRPMIRQRVLERYQGKTHPYSYDHPHRNCD